MKNLALKIIFLALALLLFSLIVFFLMTYFVFIPFDAADIPRQTPLLGKPLCRFILIVLVGLEYFTVKKLISFFKSEEAITEKTLSVFTEKPKNISMEFVPPTPQEALIGQLCSLAGYNDKGYIWQNDSPEESEKLRAQYRKDIEALIAQIGEQNFTPELLRKLRSEELMQDGSGRFVKEFEKFFEIRSE